jgi:hypothetical protein
MKSVGILQFFLNVTTTTTATFIIIFTTANKSFTLLILNPVTVCM